MTKYMEGKQMDERSLNKWKSLKNQKEWKREIQSLLCRSDKAVEVALIRIYEFQTPVEQVSNMSLTENNFGFDKIDACVLSDYAKKAKVGIGLTKEEILFVRSRILKYWKQLMVLSKLNIKNIEEKKNNEMLQVGK